MCLKKIVFFIVSVVLLCPHLLAVQMECNIPQTDNVGAEVMPQFIEPFHNLPFKMHLLKYPTFPDYTVNVKDYAITANKPITELVNRLIMETCQKGGGKVVIPAGKWKSGRIVLKSNVNLHLEEGAEIEFSGNPKDYLQSVYTMHEGRQIISSGSFIYAFNEKNIAITGKGHIYGPPMDLPIRKNSNSIAWIEKDFPERIEERIFDGMNERRFFAPKVIAPVQCKDVLIEGMIIERCMFWNINPILCENVIIRGVTVNSVGIPSGDGVDITCSKNVLVEYCTMNCGDDCYAIKGGRNEEGARMGISAENVIIRNCLAKAGHGGLTTGSETGGGIKNIYAYNCVFDGTDMPLRFKTRRPRTGITENIFYERLRIKNANTVFAWDLLGSYNFVGELANRLPLRPVTKLTPTVRNVCVKNFIVESANCFISARGIPELPISNIQIEDGIVQCENLMPIMHDFENFTLRNLSIVSKQNRIHVLEGKKMLMENIKFSLPENKLYLKVEGEQSEDINFKNIHPNIEIIKE